jgi:hypothetical protein
MNGCKKWHSISEAKCKYCGRTFVPGVEHALKEGSDLFCKPTCFLHRHEIAKNKCRKVIAIRDGVSTIYRSAVTAANELGLEVKSIRDACRTGDVYRGYTWAYDL